MNEIIISCSKESPQDISSEIEVSITNDNDEPLLYKFIVGLEGTWKTLRDFSVEKSFIWKPEEAGSYILMVQAKSEESGKAFDYVSRKQFTVGYDNEKLINNIYIEKSNYKVGEKVTVTVEIKAQSILFRYFIKEGEKWILAKDYCTENIFTWSANSEGKKEILVQCKFSSSEKPFEDAKKVDFQVEGIGKLEIKDFRCLNSSLLADEEIMFQVNAKQEDSRTTLYKFVKLYSNGQAKCIQDYSTKKIVSFKEEIAGEYRLLCLAKDMYSPKEYDDRAIMHYKVAPYMPIEVQSFTSDISSPQEINQKISLKALVNGGKELRYRFIIEGAENEDSGYVKSNSFLWEPKKEGNYKISLWVKDISFKGKYEVAKSIDFIIDEISRDPVIINEVILSKGKNILVGEEVTIKTIAQGGGKLLYSYLIKKDNNKHSEINYEENNILNFNAEEPGKYVIEIKVKDKYSSKEFDVHSIVSLKVYEYIPAVLDYVLMEPREYYLVGDQISLDVITGETQNTLIKYGLFINGHKVEETQYGKSKRYIVTPKCSGKYSIKVYAKNEKSTEEYDCIKEMIVAVNDALPIMNTRLKCDKINFFANEPITVTSDSIGGKDVLYEFYLMEKDDWTLVQSYSKRATYTFMPFSKGIYKMLVLAKSSYKNVGYEDYCIMDFRVNDKVLEYKDIINNNVAGNNKYRNVKSMFMDIKLTNEEIEALHCGF